MGLLFNEGPHPVKREDNDEIAKIHERNFEIFSRTTEPISTKLGTNLYLVKMNFFLMKGFALFLEEVIAKLHS